MSLSDNEKTGDPELITRDFMSVKSKVRDLKLPAYPRASGIYDSCMRQLVLMNSSKISHKDFTNFSLNVTLEIGNAVHYWAQNTEAFVYNHMKCGRWWCRSCNHVTQFIRYREVCPVCGAKRALTYEEYSFKIEKPLYITGHPDMFVEKQKGIIRIMEFKTITPVTFDKLKAPLIEHQWQLQAYMWACSKLKDFKSIPFDKEYGYIMYICKTMRVKDSPIKTFLVKRDKFILDNIISKLKLFKAGFDSGVLPEASKTCINSNFSGSYTNNCPVVKQCKLYLTNDN